jgi:hypothetical protein
MAAATACVSLHKSNKQQSQEKPAHNLRGLFLFEFIELRENKIRVATALLK